MKRIIKALYNQRDIMEELPGRCSTSAIILPSRVYLRLYHCIHVAKVGQ